MKNKINQTSKIVLFVFFAIALFSVSCKITNKSTANSKTTVTNGNKSSKPDLTNIPELNKKVIEYVSSVMGKKVDRGECWDVANQALLRINADWDKRYKFGKLVDPKKETIYPGDMIHFKNVKTKWSVGNATYSGSMAEHTAIVYEVVSTGVYKVAEQNTSYSGKTVGIGDFNLSHVVKGTVEFYRPVKK